MRMSSSSFSMYKRSRIRMSSKSPISTLSGKIPFKSPLRPSERLREPENKPFGFGMGFDALRRNGIGIRHRDRFGVFYPRALLPCRICPCCLYTCYTWPDPPNSGNTFLAILASLQMLRALSTLSILSWER